MKSYAKGVLEYSNNENYNQTINILDDKQLTIGMHLTRLPTIQQTVL